jgi:hypothetical protein
LCIPAAAANQGGDAFGEGTANNQAAQAIDQGSLFGGAINQLQAGKPDNITYQKGKS